MIATSCPGSVARVAGAVTCASTLPAATAMPGGSPVSSAPAAVSVPARLPSGDSGRPASRVCAKSPNSGLSALR